MNILVIIPTKKEFVFFCTSCLARDSERKKELHALTGALTVAWEGAGGARACQFSDTPFVEIRGITDSANLEAASDFKANLERVMRIVAMQITDWARGRISSEHDDLRGQ